MAERRAARSESDKGWRLDADPVRFPSMIVRRPSRAYRLGEPLPPLGWNTVPWPWKPSAALTEFSTKALRLPLGTVIETVLDGHPAVAQIQTHDRYGARPDLSPRPHAGTSVFALASHNDDGKLCAVIDPPEGWGVADSGSSGDGISGEVVPEKPATPRRWAPWVPPGVSWRAVDSLPSVRLQRVAPA